MSALFSGAAPPPPPNPTYYTAEICLNGHVISEAIEIIPEATAKFCSLCGSTTVRKCSKCSAVIRGYFRDSLNTAKYHPPGYCYECGAAMPWTALKIEAAKESVAEIAALDPAERQQLQAAIDDLASDGPRTDLAASRFKRLMKKAGQAAGSGLYKIAIDLASETAKKTLLG